MSKQKILLIGWDAADWNIINPLLDSGQMPTLEKLVNGGTMGNIATLEPVISPMLWTSIATGKYADKHGILGFAEVSSLGNGIKPIMSTSRTTKALWNMLMQSGYKSHVIGWWPSHPAEPLNGITISNLFGKTGPKKGNKSLILENSVHPKEYLDLFKEFRIYPDDLTGAHLLPFIPRASEINQKNDKSLHVLAESIVEATNYHSAATWILENEEWDFMGIYLNAIDHICHKFIKYHPPQLPNMPDEKYHLYKEVVNGMYRFNDMMLDQLLKYTDENTTVVLVSDHGFNSDEKRLIATPKEPAGVAYDHRPYGVFCIKGPGIKKDERVYGASLLDVTPTILHSAGLPVGIDMDGKPLVQIFENPGEVKRIESWDLEEGDSGFIGKTGSPVEHFTSSDELKQLVDLGYIEDPGDNVKLAIDRTLKESRFNKVRVYINSSRFKKARHELESLISDFPDEYRFQVRLAMVLQILSENDACMEIISKLKNIETNRLKDISNQTSEEKEQHKLKSESVVPMHTLLLLEGNVFLNKNEPAKALEIFDKLEKIMPMNPKILVQKGKAYLLHYEWDNAIKYFSKAIEKDPDNASAHHGLSKAYMNNNDYERSIESSLDAISLQYYYPWAHYYLGLGLFKIEEYENATNALELSLSQESNLAKARNLLIRIYRDFLGNSKRADELETQFKEQKDNYITLVSGIPRSGTSLMMQMLEASGIELFTDNKRAADIDNKKGYYEHELVKSLAANSNWLLEVGSKAVKIISQLLFHLPDKYNYRILFMKRDLKEVIHSQQTMVKNQKGKEINTFPVGLERAYETNLNNVERWAKSKKNVEILYVEHRNLFSNPDKELLKVGKFLNKDLDIKRMKDTIDSKLYRSVF